MVLNKKLTARLHRPAKVTTFNASGISQRHMISVNSCKIYIQLWLCTQEALSALREERRSS
jgi:hypothetical protein